MDNFYDYCNKEWETHTIIPSYRGAYGVSEELENDLKDTMIDLIKKLPASHSLATVWSSAIHREDESNMTTILHLLHRIASLETIESIGKAIGLFNKWQLRSPLSLLVTRDAYNSSLCRIHFYEPTLGIPSYNAYRTHSNPTLTAYRHMLQEAGKQLKFSDLETVSDIEQKVYEYLSPDGALDDPTKSHFPYTFDALTKTYPSIPFGPMLEAWGISSSILSSTTLIVTNPRYMNAFDRMCRTFEMGAFHIWLQAYAIITLLRYLPESYNKLYFQFYDHFLQGTTKPLPPNEFAIGILQKMMPQSLGKVLFQHTPRAKDRKTKTIHMVHQLKRAAIHRLEAVEWLSPETRAIAARKIRIMHMDIGYPRIWNEPRVSLSPTHLLENIIKLGEADTKQSISDIGRACAKADGIWEDGIFLVNAFYYADQNKMVIPFGMLQAPFFDLKKSIGWNYGGIGCAIAHEMTHGFDEDGRMYDETGSWKNWWSEQDELHYHEQTDKLVKLFDKRPYKGGHVNGTLTLDENLADLGGMAIALQALVEELGDNTSKRIPFLRDFFIAYAISWRLKDRSKKASQALQIDQHAPPEFRVNLIVSQFPEFYEAFTISEDSPMWIPPEKRIKLW
jgi:predicted metalloendopeptidase